MTPKPSEAELRELRFCQCRAPDRTPCILVRGDSGDFWMCAWCEIPEGTVFAVVPDEDESDGTDLAKATALAERRRQERVVSDGKLVDAFARAEAAEKRVAELSRLLDASRFAHKVTMEERDGARKRVEELTAECARLYAEEHRLHVAIEKQARAMATAAVREALVSLRRAGDLLWAEIFGDTDMSWAEVYRSFCEANENADKALAATASPSRIEAKRPLPPGDLANALQDRIHPASGRLLSASPVVAKPTAGIREALEAAVDFIATGDFTDDARRQAIAKAESALVGAEAGERVDDEQYVIKAAQELPDTPADKLDEWQWKFDLVCDLRQRELIGDEAYERVKASLVRELHAMTGKEAP